MLNNWAIALFFSAPVRTRLMSVASGQRHTISKETGHPSFHFCHVAWDKEVGVEGGEGLVFSTISTRKLALQLRPPRADRGSFPRQRRRCKLSPSEYCPCSSCPARHQPSVPPPRRVSCPCSRRHTFCPSGRPFATAVRLFGTARQRALWHVHDPLSLAHDNSGTPSNSNSQGILCSETSELLQLGLPVVTAAHRCHGCYSSFPVSGSCNPRFDV